MSRRFIVKVQLPITITEPILRVLIYNEDKSVFQMFEATDELIERVGPRKKKYMWAHIDEDSKLVLDEDAPEQDW